MTAHALLGASAAERWLQCPGSVAGEARPRQSSVYAAEGTAAHQVLTWALQQGKPADHWAGTTVQVDDHAFEVDDEMVASVQLVLDYVAQVSDGGRHAVLVDQRVNYSRYLGVPGDLASGTLDVAVITDTELVTIDLKYGKGKLVRAEQNPQLTLYALGQVAALQGLVDLPSRARLVIWQPRLREQPDEWDVEVAALEAWAEDTARDRAQRAVQAVRLYRPREAGFDRLGWESDFLRPSETACRWCASLATCPAARDDIADAVGLSAASPEEFSDLTRGPVMAEAASSSDWLAAAHARLDQVEAWCKAVEAETFRRLNAGEAVGTLKLVEGRRGARAWADAVAAEAYLRKTVRLPIEAAYTLKLITPTLAEKLAKKGDIGPRQWATLKEAIVQPAGRSHVAPADDPRPAIQATRDEFENLA